MRRLISRLAALAVIAAGMVVPAKALVVINNELFTSFANEKVYAVFIGSSAAFTDLLFQTTPAPQLLFNENTAVLGDQLFLGTFANNTEMKFQLNVYEQGAPYAQWHTGVAANNTDGLQHAQFLAAGANAYFLKWEDYALNDPRNDFDFDDHIIALVGIEDREPIVPEPATLGLMGIGLSLFGTLKMRKRRA